MPISVLNALYFIRRKPEIANTVDHNGSNALQLSAQFGTVEGTKCLVEKHHFDVFERNQTCGKNSFLLSAAEGKQQQMEYFIEQDPKILKSVALDKRNALHISARSGTLKVTKFLAEQHQFNMFDSSNIHERNAFLCSASGGKVDQMEYFLRKNPNLAKTSNSDKFNALHLSAKFGTLQGTKFLVEIHNFDMFDFNRFGRNSFLCAASNGKLDQVQYFIKKNSAIKYSKDKDMSRLNKVNKY